MGLISGAIDAALESIGKSLLDVGEWMLETGYTLWKNAGKLTLDYVKISPMSHSGGWGVVTGGVYQMSLAIAASLAVLFFVMGWLRESIDIRNNFTLENMFRFFVRYAITASLIVNSLSLVRSNRKKMIKTLYEIFQHWSAKGSVYLLSDLHLNDDDCLLMDPDWIPTEEQIGIINNKVTRGDTFICLGDVGRPEFAAQIKAGHKVLLLGNHDHRKDYKDIFDEIYEGPLFISEKILLSHEPVYGLSWCLNIHGHDHNGIEPYAEGCKHLNLAANVCGYTPVSLGDLIKGGILADINGIHRQTIDRAAERKQMKRHLNEGINMFSDDYINSIEERSDEK